MSSSEKPAWPSTFHCEDFVRLRDEPSRFGAVVAPGGHPDEWLIAFADGERDVYLFEHLEPFVPTAEQREGVRIYHGIAPRACRPVGA